MRKLSIFLTLLLMSVTTSLMAQRSGYNCENGVFSNDARLHHNIPEAKIPTDIKVNTIPGRNGGTGTAEDPYIVSKSEDLVEIANRINTGTEGESTIFPGGNLGYANQYFKLANDITYDVFVQIGNYDHYFYGNFNGDGYSIYGIKCDNVELSGLFYTLGPIATIENLSIYGSVTGGYYAGGLTAVAMQGSKITNVHNYCTVDVTGYYGAGIAGASWGTIIGCTNNANITSTTDFVGGIVADCYFDIYDCVNTGDISGAGSVGGVIGYSFPHNVARCVNAGNINGQYYSGGVIGFVDNYNYPDLICSNLVNVGEIINGDASVIGRLWVENGVEGHADNCFYNSQNSTLGGYMPGTHADWVQPKTVSEMIGEGLSEYLEGWTFNEGLFPLPSLVAEAETAICAATPAYFYNENGNVNVYNNLDKDFAVCTANEAEWSFDSDIITFEDGYATLNAAGSGIMTVTVGNSSKRYNIVVSQPDNVEENIAMNCRVYPNPANDFIVVDGQNITNVKIYNVSGQCVIDFEASNSQEQISVSHLNPGLYIVRTQDNNNNVTSTNISIVR